MELLDKIVLMGPYIGDWKEEIVSFRPYVKWIYENIKFSDYFVSSHYNRLFLYDFIKEENRIPIYENLSREESKQKNAVHKDIQIKDYNSIILRNIKDHVSKITGYMKKDIYNYSLSYVKSDPNFTYLNKSFTNISYKMDESKQKIVFIPDACEDKEILETVANHLDKFYKDEYIVVGDKKCRLKDQNVVMERIDYFEMVFKIIVDYISNAKLVICPCSHWTILSNQQGSYVLSWSSNSDVNIAQYKKNGIYGFNNNNSIVDIDRSLLKKNLLSQIDYTINDISRRDKND